MARVGVACLMVIVMSVGCGPPPAAPPPVNVQQYRDMQLLRRMGYPPRTVLLYNLQRVLDNQLSAASRLASMKVVADLDGREEFVLEQLAEVLGDSQTPQSVREEVLAYLLQRDYPELTQHVIAVLPHLHGSRELRGVLLDWLVRHPTPKALAEVVKAWADVPTDDRAAEEDFRVVVERLTGSSWYQALLDALNAQGFTARGSAIEVLTRRVVPATLKRDLMNLPARTEAVVVLQTFIRRFDALPASGPELLSMAHIHRYRSDLLAQAAELNVSWRRFDGYRFNIRDFHLLSRLAADPKHAATSRAELVADLVRSLLRRRHVPQHTIPSGRPDPAVRFDHLADRLSMADLWNLWLLDEMLTRPTIQAAIAIMADEDRADRSRALGGLVFLENGRAQAKLYPPNPLAAPDDLVYTPSSRALVDGRDSLCRFQGHFETLENAARAGPTEAELRDARMGNYYLLVLTSLDNATFCAHYANPEGEVVSLGQFPLAR